MKIDLKNIKIQPATKLAAEQQLKPLLLPIVVVLITIGLLLLVLKPRLDSILQLRDELKAERIRLENLQTKADELASYDRNKLLREVKLADQALPFEKDVSSAILGMERLSADAGLLIDGLALSPGEVSTESATTDQNNEIEIKASFRGSFTAIKEFTKRVHQSLRIFGIKGFVISAVSAGDSSSLGGSFDLIAYFSPLPKALGNIDAPLPKISDQEAKIMTKITNYQFVSSVPVATSSSRLDPFERF